MVMSLLRRLRSALSGSPSKTHGAPNGTTRCPTCAPELAISQRYLAADVDLSVRYRHRKGNAAPLTCEACQKSFAIALPVIYDDPDYNLLVFVCTADSETLIDEFHRLLESCRESIGGQRYQQALRRPFQTVLGWHGLGCLIRTAQDNPPGARRIRPVVNSFLYMNMFVEAAHANDAGGNPRRCFDIMVRSARYPIYEPELLRIFSKGAREAGYHTHADALSTAADNVRGGNSHVWELPVVSEALVNQVPEYLRFPLMQSRLREAYNVIRPDGYLWPELESEVGGLACGFLEIAKEEFGKSLPLLAYAAKVEKQFNRLLGETQADGRDALIAIFMKTREEARRLGKESVKY